MRRALTSLVLLAACGDAPLVTSTAKDTGTPPPPDGEALDQPDIEVKPVELRFGTRTIGCAAEPKTITVKNVGVGELLITDIELRGPGFEAYTLSGPIDTESIAAGEEIELTVGFEPTELKDYDAVNVRVRSNDPDEEIVKTDIYGAGGEFSTAEEFFLQEEERAVDVLWVFDTSSSIASERTTLINQMGNFIGQFVNLGLDYQIGITTTDMLSSHGAKGRLLGAPITPGTADPVGEFKRQMNTPMAQGCDGSSSGGSSGGTSSPGCDTEMGFDASWAALSTRAGEANNKDLVRADATLAVAVFSDEDDSSESSAYGGINQAGAARYVTSLTSLKTNPADVTFSAMVGPDGAFKPFELNACGGGILANVSAMRAGKYHRAIRDTGGVWGNICKFEVAPFLTHLAYVAAGLEYRFPLSATPSSTNPLNFTVEVNGKEVPWGEPDGFTYNEDEQAIELHGSWIPGPGESVYVVYTLPAGDCFVPDTGTP